MQQIGVGHGHPKPSVGRNRTYVRSLPVSVLDDESAAWSKEHGCARNKITNISKSIRSAEQREGRVVAHHLLVQRSGVVRDVGRIRHDDIDGSVQFRQHIRDVTDDEMNSPVSVARDIPFRPCGGSRRQFDREDLGVGNFSRESERERSGSRPEVHRPWVGNGDLTKRFNRPLGDEFGFGSRNEDTITDRKNEMAKWCYSRDVLQRFTCLATRSELVDADNHILVKFGAHECLRRDFPACPSRDVPNEKFRIG
jgi:hypothetical protein